MYIFNTYNIMRKLHISTDTHKKPQPVTKATVETTDIQKHVIRVLRNYVFDCS